ncbi:hypothetical protein SBOR_2487 [Sclerotinia borealis F-4128]|uniref:SAP domain-containing protein n=1 Tax=Sclerotinia borealis (strain F-4128) TaxID=1432307 RepID=W9CRA1_SCLBF|nr:hypothetical protein SBOR_2487 [Sclerotinia borealis F-4128]
MAPPKRPLGQVDTNPILPLEKRNKGKDNNDGILEGEKREGKRAEKRGQENGEGRGESMEILTKKELIMLLKGRGLSINHGAKESAGGEMGGKTAATAQNRESAASTPPIVEESHANSSRNKISASKPSGNENQLDYRTKDDSKLRTLLRDWRVMEPKEVESIWYSGRDDSSLRDLSIQLRILQLRRTLPYTQKPPPDKYQPRRQFGRNKKLRAARFCGTGKKDEEQVLKVLSDPTIPYETLEYLGSHRLAITRGLSTLGVNEAIIKRLRVDDQKPESKSKDKQYMSNAIERLTALTKRHTDAYDKMKKKLEERVGHPIKDIAAVIRHFEALCKRDQGIVDNYQPTRKPAPPCDYDWKASHWANRSTRELQDICQRRGTQLSGSKASMIKYLETGVIDYENLYNASLEGMCTQRGIKYKWNETRLDLAGKLRETDDKELVYRDLGVTALRKMCKERGVGVKASESKQELVTRLREADENAGGG